MTISLGLSSTLLVPSLMRNLGVWEHPTRSHAGALLCMAVGIGGHWLRHNWLPARQIWSEHITRQFIYSLPTIVLAL